MIYITGDTHGDFSRFLEFCHKNQTTESDLMVVLGDAGLNYYNDKRDLALKLTVSRLPITFLCIHGNHEMRPTDVPGYTEKDFSGGTVLQEPQFPTLLFAKDGEVYDLVGQSCIVIGGAYSVDKYHRLNMGYRWFANEQPSYEIRSYVERQLDARENRVDIVFSHTCPYKYEPREVFLDMIDQSTVDKSTELWLDHIESTLSYSKWYCGHYHTSKCIDRLQFMYKNICELKVIQERSRPDVRKSKKKQQHQHLPDR